MKSAFHILLISLILFSCKKEEFVPIFQPGSMTYGRTEAFKNKKEWIASTIAQENDWLEGTVSVHASTYNEQGLLRESLSISEIPLKEGIYPLEVTRKNDGAIGAAYHTWADDGDVLEDSYMLDKKASDNYLEIILVDTIARKIAGKFTASFKIDTSLYGIKANPLNPDKVKFSNGMFEAEIID
jgi:hypothetical protein